MQLVTWGYPKVVTEVKLGDMEEFAAQKICEALNHYSPDFQGVYSVKPEKHVDMGSGGWAGKNISLELGVYVGGETMILQTSLWVISHEEKVFKAFAIMKIVAPDGRDLRIEYDGDEVVRGIYLQEQVIYYHWGKVGAKTGLPQLHKFFVLDPHSTN